MKNFATRSQATALSLAILTLSGCAVPPGAVKEQVALKTTEISLAAQSMATQKKQEPPLLVIRGNFLGSIAQSIDSAAQLPPLYRDVVLNYGSATGTLSQIASNIRKSTGLSVRINPDISTVNAPGQFAGTQAVQAAVRPPAQVGVPIAQTGLPVPGLTLGSNLPAVQAAPAVGQNLAQASLLSRQLPLSFSGDLAEYLNQTASALGISWEFTNGEVHFFRVMTKMFTLSVSPGSVTYSDTMSGGGSGSSSGGTAQSSTGGQTYGSTHSSSTTASINPWDSINEAMKSLISPSGKFAISQSTGTLVVSDTKEVVERVERWVKHENATLRAQVVIDVREIIVQLDDKSEIGLDLNLVYNKLNASTGTPDWAFKFVAPATLTESAASSGTFNLIKANNRWAGSSAAVQALNTVGQIVGDFTDSIVTTNRVPGRKQDVTDQAYLASTTPASGGATTAGTGVPGLTPGVVTYGTNLTVVPTIGENNTVLLQLFDTRSDLLGINSVSTGSGTTLQQINTPTVARRKYTQNFSVSQGETLVIVGTTRDTWNATTAYGATGVSNLGKRSKTLQVLMVTPKILQGT